MNIKAIENDNDLKQAFKQLEPIFQAVAGTAEAEVSLIEEYENKHSPI